MTTEKLLKTLPIIQKQLEALVAFDIQASELTNGVINSCFVLMSKDLIRLFACYNDGVINLLEKFFEMNKKHCKDALDLYKKFLDRTDKVSAFLKVAEVSRKLDPHSTDFILSSILIFKSSGMDKGDIPDLTKAPGSLLEALESHVNNLENKKGGAAGGSSTSAAASASASSSHKFVNSNHQINVIHSFQYFSLISFFPSFKKSIKIV